MSSPTISAADVKALRDRTGAGMMDCKAALTESGGDVDKAIEILRVKGQAAAAKRGDRAAAEGTVQSYIHFTNKIGALVEVDCETDFVARNEDFVDFARAVASHVASAAPQFVSETEVSERIKLDEMRIYLEQAADKPEDVRPRIAEGRWRKWLEENVLLNQPHVNTERYDGKTIEDLRAELSAKTGENVVIRRFVRFVVGE
jgi:elongation factor Ts